MQWSVVVQKVQQQPKEGAKEQRSTIGLTRTIFFQAQKQCDGWNLWLPFARVHSLKNISGGPDMIPGSASDK